MPRQERTPTVGAERFAALRTRGRAGTVLGGRAAEPPDIHRRSLQTHTGFEPK